MVHGPHNTGPGPVGPDRTGHRVACTQCTVYSIKDVDGRGFADRLLFRC